MANPKPSPGETLAQHYFTDPSTFEEETQKIFRDRWLFVERASTLKNVGDYVSVDLEGEGLLAAVSYTHLTLPTKA